MIDSLLAEAPPDRPAVSFGDSTLTYRELESLTERLAHSIEEAAGGADLTGMRVAVVAPNTPLLVASLFATWRLGAAVVPLSSRLRERELELTLADAEPRVVVSIATHGGYSFRDVLPRPSLPSVRAFLFGAADGTLAPTLPGTRDVPPTDPVGTDVAALLYTSGTTGLPKGVLVSHRRELEGSRFLADTLALREDESVGHVVPISHAFGLTCLHATITAGAHAVLVESTFSPGPLLAALEAAGATVLHGSPALFVSLVKARPEAVAKIRAGLVAGAPAPPALLEQLDELGARILDCYGLTETGAVTCCALDDPLELRVTTCGRAAPSYELRVADGELEVRGPHLTPGYYRRPDETLKAFRHDWFRTGDLAELDNAGYLRIVGRAKDIVHVGGFNVVPAEVEAVLLSHPEVENAAVLGVPDERMGEALRAFVSLGEDAQVTSADLIAYARSRIAGYKVPYAIELLPELPLLPSGKPDRRALAR